MFNPYDYYITPEEYEEAARNGISRKRLNDRIRLYGWGKQEAITASLQIHKDRSGIMELAKANGISYAQFSARIRVCGWDELKAATTPLRDSAWVRENAQKMIEKKRILPREMVELARSNGISDNTFWYRVRKSGWDITRAATTPASAANRQIRLKEIYGEDYLKNYFKTVRGWLFFPGAARKGMMKKLRQEQQDQ